MMTKKNDASPVWWAVCLTVVFSAVLLLVKEVKLSWLIIILAICGALWQVWKQCRIWWRGKSSRVAGRERLFRVLASLMGFFLATGSALYLTAFCYVNANFVNAEYLLRSIICSLDLFMLDIESNVLDQIRGHYYLKGLISIQAVLSFSCTVALLLSLIYARVKAYRKLHWHTKVDDNHNHLYIFFGINEPSCLLAKSIHKKENDQAIIVFVEKSPVDDKDRGGWDSIVEMFTHRRQHYIEAEDVDARITFTETRLCDINKEELTKNDILGEINLIMLRNLIQDLSVGVPHAELHVFFLSDNEDENIRSVSTLAQDETINAGVGKIVQRFYCHARRNGLNRVVEDIAVKKGLEIRVIDSACLAVDLLKSDDRNHPVRLVETDEENPTTVKSAFHSLIVGFDEAGQDAFKYLYEFGAFVYSRSEDNRSPFFCTIVDQRMGELEGHIHAFAPAVMTKSLKDDNVHIRMESLDCRSKSFYEIFDDSFKKSLNYVVIAVGNDELGMTCAIRIFNYIRQSREDMSKMRIYVRSYQSDKEDYMQKIADHYNEGYNNDMRNKLNKDEQDDYIDQTIIIPFGQNKKIYSYRTIIDEEFTIKGKCFQESYAKMKGETELWETRRNILMGVKKYVKDDLGHKTIIDIPLTDRKTSLDNIRSLRRKESQDLANALHAGTKLYLLKKAFDEDYDWHDFLERYFETDGETPNCEGSRNSISYKELNERENKAISNLAQLEHLRWNASHEMLGYVKAEKDLHECNERLRQHNCLRPWNELDKESQDVTKEQGWEADYKSFDFGVVDTSILLYKDILLNQISDSEEDIKNNND